MGLLVAVVISVFFGSCHGATELLKPYNQTAYFMFLPVDTNGDGIMTLQELRVSFYKYDTDGNGVETRREYTEYICASTRDLYQLSHYLFDEYDVIPDGLLMEDDYQGMYNNMDGDNNNLVDLDEFILFWENVFPKYENTPIHPSTYADGSSPCH